MSLDRFSNFAILENFRNRFHRNYESQKAESLHKMDNDWMYCVYRNRGLGSIPHLGALKKWYMHGQRVGVSCFQESGPRAHNLD